MINEDAPSISRDASANWKFGFPEGKVDFFVCQEELIVLVDEGSERESEKIRGNL